MNNVVRRLDVYAESDGDRRKNKDTEARRVLKGLDSLLPTGDVTRGRTCITVNDVGTIPEFGFDVMLQESLNLPELAKDDSLLALRSDFGELPE